MATISEISGNAEKGGIIKRLEWLGMPSEGDEAELGDEVDRKDRGDLYGCTQLSQLVEGFLVRLIYLEFQLGVRI